LLECLDWGFIADTISKAYNRIIKQVKAESDGDKVFEGNKNPNTAFFFDTSFHTPSFLSRE
jgi:hypothetical protein